MATHGFFFSGSGRATAGSTGSGLSGFGESQRSASGLILAGETTPGATESCNRGKEDGILTAYEISQMNLSNTELVVPLPCETGLGDIEGNEGVCGFATRFQDRWGKYLIMSLWQVPDRETMQFMTTFYRNWLEPEDGGKMTIPEAFRKDPAGNVGPVFQSVIRGRGL